MQKCFKNIAIIGRPHTFGVAETLLALLDFLTSLGVNIITDPTTAEIIPDKKLTTLPRQRFSEKCEIIIVVGGDGSLLHIAPFAAKQNLPVLGINRGHTGFLTDIHPDHIDDIEPILSGNYREQQRFLLNVQIFQGDMLIKTDAALNDAVLSSGATTQLVEFSISIDGNCVCDYRADGLIIATPTGSTAYALSGGGPILHPNLEAIDIVPMFPHNLSSRPIIIKGESVVNIAVARSNAQALGISCDGKKHNLVSPGNRVTIHKADDKLRLIHPVDYNYYATLRSKLHWEQ